MSCDVGVPTWLSLTSNPIFTCCMLLSLNTENSKIWYVLLIITNIHCCSTSKYKGNWTSCTLEVKCDHGTRVGQWNMSESDRHHFWAKAFNCLGLILQSSLLLPEQSWKSRVKIAPTLALWVAGYIVWARYKHLFYATEFSELYCQPSTTESFLTSIIISIKVITNSAYNSYWQI